MKVKDIVKLIPDKIVIYKKVSDDRVFEDLYRGDSSSIPTNVADMEIESIGAARKGVVDIKVN